MNSTDGTVKIADNTPSGVYTFTYTICENGANPANCDTATVTITVNVIDAVDDNFNANGSSTTTSTTTVFANDVFNGSLVNPADITFTPTPFVATPAGGIILNTDGTVTVQAGTPAGTYTTTYQICIPVLSICDTATVTVQVTANAIVAVDDDYRANPLYTTTGGTLTTTSILDNDTLNGSMATLGTVTITNVISPNTNIYVDTNGMVVVLPNTPAGTYTLTYEICELTNTSNCSNRATITVLVLDVPKANDDVSTTEINTPVTIEVLTNDENIPTQGHISVVGNPSEGNAYVNDGGTPNDPTDDTITYTPNAGFIGKDSFVYELCDAAGNCSTATVTIDVVGGGEIIPYNAISTNDDGSNDIFYIKGIESYPNNTVRIYNRWGVKVFEAQGYNNTTKVFRGISNGRVTIEAPEKLPQGTYYYVIEYVDKNNQTKRKASWLYIKK